MNKTFPFRPMAAIFLSLLVLSGLAAPSAFINRASAAGNARAAYKQTVQDLVSLYGICESGKLNIDEDARGIISVVCVDMFGDSTEELFVARLEPTTVPSGDMGPLDAVCTIYVFNENKYVNESCTHRTEGAYMTINGDRAGDRFLLTSSPTKIISDGMLWDGDSWLYKSAIEGRTPEEQAWVDEQAQTYGNSGWGSAELALLHKRCGFTSELQDIFSLEGQGEIKTAINGNFYYPEECVAMLYDSVPADSASANPLDAVAYVGDRTLCKMPAAMANAYADAIASVSGDDVRAALVDIANDGMPVLVTAICEEFPSDTFLGSFDIWVWDGTSAKAYPFEDCVQTDSGYAFGLYEGVPALYTRDTTNSVGAKGGCHVYRVSNGNLSLMHNLSYVPQDANNDVVYYYKDGARITEEEYFDYSSRMDVKYAPFSLGTGDWLLTEDFSGEQTAIESLRSYAAAASADNSSTADSTSLQTLGVSNMTPDYNKISSFNKSKDLVKYIDNLLDDMGETAPNDTAKNELTMFIETAISNICMKKMFSWGNSFSLGNRLSSAIKKAQGAKTDAEGLLAERGITLNNPIDVVVPVLWRNCNLKKPCTVKLSAESANILNGMDLRIYLGDSRHYLQFSADNTRDITDNLGAMEIVFTKGDNDTYEIECLDRGGYALHLSAPIAVGLPASSETATVMATYDGETRNWGGQFDAASQLISFETRYRGQYQVQDYNVEIGDISHLSKESQDAIRFLVSKGYLGLADGNFLPDSGLTRYQFTQALVGMFFALDANLAAPFPDVPAENNPFYPYVASGAHRNIVEGYDDGLFYGDNAMTVEQMLALAARTLVSEKGYAYPSDPAAYLDHVSIEGNISGWAVSDVALAIRDGLWSYSDVLQPAEFITREQAALILYRLFLLLHEVSPMAQDTMVNVVMIAVVAVASITIIICIALIVILIKKNNDINKRKRGNIRQ